MCVCVQACVQGHGRRGRECAGRQVSFERNSGAGHEACVSGAERGRGGRGTPSDRRPRQLAAARTDPSPPRAAVPPHRLTQNVADACGVSGVEGGFRRAAEITLKARPAPAPPRGGAPAPGASGRTPRPRARGGARRAGVPAGFQTRAPLPATPPQVLRANRAALMTTAETFLADPLVEWTKAHRGAGGEPDNPMARRAQSRPPWVPAPRGAAPAARAPCGARPPPRSAPWARAAAALRAGRGRGGSGSRGPPQPRRL
jgi:hypothetical protein